MQGKMIAEINHLHSNRIFMCCITICQPLHGLPNKNAFCNIYVLLFVFCFVLFFLEKVCFDFEKKKKKTEIKNDNMLP